jgi:hypothetical protein
MAYEPTWRNWVGHRPGKLVFIWFYISARIGINFRRRQQGSPVTTFAQRLGPIRTTGHLPLYQQLERALRSAVERGLLAPEDALPPERDLAADLGVSRITVR